MKAISTIGIRVLCMIAAGLLSGCGADRLSWTEDIRLPDGSSLTLQRSAEFRGPRRTESRQTMEFRSPISGEQVRWENSAPDPQLGIVALWLEGNTPQVLTRPLYVGDEMRLDCPSPPYLLYEFVSGRWRELPWDRVPKRAIRANVTTFVLSDREKIESSGHHLTSAQTSDFRFTLPGVRHVPFVVHLDPKVLQTHGLGNCNRERNTLIKDSPQE